MNKVFWVCFFLVFSFAKTGYTDATKILEKTWTQWISDRDRELKDPAKSYLNVRDLQFLKPGETIYLKMTSKEDLHWQATKPEQPHLTFSINDQGAFLTTEQGEKINFLEKGFWQHPSKLLFTGNVFQGKILQLTTHDLEHPVFKQFKKSHFFPFNSKAIVTGKFEALSLPKKIKFETTRGTPRDLWQVGQVSFTYQSKLITLGVYSYSGDLKHDPELFIPFFDATNSSESYSGGRYLDTLLDAKNPKTIRLDFNRAYQPLCAKNHVFNCLRVLGNPIPFKILAGERN